MFKWLLGNDAGTDATETKFFGDTLDANHGTVLVEYENGDYEVYEDQEISLNGDFYESPEANRSDDHCIVVEEVIYVGMKR